MQNNIGSKGFVILIIVIFIGVEVIPSTVGIVSEKAAFNSPISNGYIQGLIDNASEGDTIYIPSGTYYENIVINKSISLIGEDKNTTIIDGNGFENTVYITDNHINISEFTIRNSNDSYDYAGIRVTHKEFGGNENTIKNNILICNGNGIFITGHRNIVYNNIVTSNNVGGIYINSGDENAIFGNNVTGNGINGIVIAWTSYNNITGNNIINNGYTGIRIENSENTMVYNNKISGNEHGISQGRSCNSIISENYIIDSKIYNFWLTRSCNNDILRNYFGQTNFSIKDRIWFYSVLICYDSDNNTFSFNTVSNDYVGICIGLESYNNTCYMNNITNCINGINIDTALWEELKLCSFKKGKPNFIIKNNFIDNQIHALSKYWIFSLFGSRWDGNYWGKQRIFPKIIFGLIMYGDLFGIPFRFDIDWHPAKQPYDIPKIAI